MTYVRRGFVYRFKRCILCNNFGYKPGVGFINYDYDLVKLSDGQWGCGLGNSECKFVPKSATIKCNTVTCENNAWSPVNHRRECFSVACAQECFKRSVGNKNTVQANIISNNLLVASL